ncbi:AraC family transcriptional regulator [Candidatus Regiella insecticola]|uniref:AraC family transcriptional regulator n=1 Tax=Candidatus Regiella insecticola TaxID=138073 RepID=A0A6L2ZNZ3_9ENTR|nr:AraC family transcriptional regulator [Candidatus Regiella insecticola]GFN46466.1 araC family transcriptional regulator [Candidatus Regiella insecticola]
MNDLNSSNFINAVQFVYDHIDQPITLKDLAKSVDMSVSSLKRLFIEATAKTPGAFIRRLRMECAFRSIQSQKDSILEVALSSGFEDQSSFARRFKETFGYSPRQARKKLNIVSELENVLLDEPDIIELTDFPIQSVTEKGFYFEAAPKAFNVLKSKLTTNELSDDGLSMFIGIGHDNPHENNVKEDEVRFTAGVVLIKRDLGIEHVILSGSRYARFHYFGKPNNLGLAYHYIYGKWSEASPIQVVKTKSAFMAFDHFPAPLKEQNILIHVPLVP